jgi:hypothetical protein
VADRRRRSGLIAVLLAILAIAAASCSPSGRDARTTVTLPSSSKVSAGSAPTASSDGSAGMSTGSSDPATGSSTAGSPSAGPSPSGTASTVGSTVAPTVSPDVAFGRLCATYCPQFDQFGPSPTCITFLGDCQKRIDSLRTTVAALTREITGYHLDLAKYPELGQAIDAAAKSWAGSNYPALCVGVPGQQQVTNDCGRLGATLITAYFRVGAVLSREAGRG